MGCKSLTYSDFSISLKVVHRDFDRFQNTCAGAYRYGFNGMESDDEVSGDNNSYDFGARMYNPRIGRWMSRDAHESSYPNLSSYSFVKNNPVTFVDPDGRDVKPSKAFLNTDYGRVFQDLRKNNLEFGKAIAKYENNKKFNLSLYVDDKKVKAAGAGAITNHPADKSQVKYSANVDSYFFSTTTVGISDKHKYTELGILNIVVHETIHQKLALTQIDEDKNHNAYNTERQNIVKIFTEYSEDNNLNLSLESIEMLSYSGQQKSTAFKKYITGLAESKGTSYAEEKTNYDNELSWLIHEKKEQPVEAPKEEEK